MANLKTITGLKLPEGKTDHFIFDDSVRGLALRLRRGSGGKIIRNWVLCYRIRGRTRRLMIGPADVLSPAVARKLAQAARLKVVNGQDPQADKQQERLRAAHSLRAVVEDYLIAKRPEWRPATDRAMTGYLTGPHFRSLHSAPIDSITRAEIASRVSTIARTSGHSTATQARTALNSLYVWAMTMGLIEHNAVIGTFKPKAAKPRDRVLGDVELVAIWRACDDLGEYGRIVQLAILLGQRRGESGGMCWSEIDRERGTWSIPSNRAKNGRSHTLPLPPLALSIIESVQQRVGRDNLFGDRSHAGFSWWAGGKQALDERLCDSVAKWTLHDLRRTVATKMCDLGIMPHVVEQILNHQSGHRSGVVATYNKSVYEREVRAAMAQWADHVRALVEGTERRVLAFQPAAEVAS